MATGLRANGYRNGIHTRSRACFDQQEEDRVSEASGESKREDRR